MGKSYKLLVSKREKNPEELAYKMIYLPIHAVETCCVLTDLHKP